MRKVILLFPLIISEIISAQIGVSTSNPQGIFHIDGGKDNSSTESPSVLQQSNDFIVTSTGNTGIGTTAPIAKLDIISNTAGAIKITDGTQGSDKVLMSDASGIGTWKIPASIRATANGVFPSPSLNVSSNGSGTIYSNVYIDLTEGKWALNAGLTISNSSNTNRIWLHAYLSTSQSSVQRIGFTHLGPATTSTSYAAVIFPYVGAGNDGTLSMLSGSSVINVTVPSVRVYLLIENKATGSWAYGTGAYENYFYGIPLN
ncbi:hypothetical protein [Chryseobacterium polytrichastri]|uniref:C1q domain-containing protein n=1 Tax=Chryseobacterium polytrichastri TaxID=1302687 RepID=A0A1M6VN62_9FLAO|nr:hypothetical protein [Chryseobacterium polytrichastri]SHK82804.1 hypothetical protein SAMN05444267_100883 [Chryseobacterium polytrichastri]